MSENDATPEKPTRPASLKTLAEHLDLNPSTISFVLNNAPNRSIPEKTRERIREAARQFSYRPSHIARTLRSKRSKTVGVMLPELGDGYHSQVLNGVADVLMREEYFFFTAHHRHRKDLVSSYPGVLHARGVEALLTIDTHLEVAPDLPTVAVAAHDLLPGVSHILLDHEHAAELTIAHLYGLGHRRIAYMRGQSFSSDSDTRWAATIAAAQRYGLQVTPGLTFQLQQNSNSPELGFDSIHDLLKQEHVFTAVICFNDVAAIGAIRSLADAGLRVPADCSVMGFDDIPAAAFQTPRLTTIRQPLQDMGRTAATLLLQKLAGEDVPQRTFVRPELVFRESTGPARGTAQHEGEGLPGVG